MPGEQGRGRVLGYGRQLRSAMVEFSRSRESSPSRLFNCSSRRAKSKPLTSQPPVLRPFHTHAGSTGSSPSEPGQQQKTEAARTRTATLEQVRLKRDRPVMSSSRFRIGALASKFALKSLARSVSCLRRCRSCRSRAFERRSPSCRACRPAKPCNVPASFPVQGTQLRRHCECSHLREYLAAETSNPSTDTGNNPHRFLGPQIRN